MSDHPARDALVAALRNPRRHLAALGVVAVGFAAAAAVGRREAYYGAGLLAFCVWMLWFVLTGIDWVRRADF